MAGPLSDAPLDLDPERPVIATCVFCRRVTTNPQRLSTERRKRALACPACCIERGYPIKDCRC